MHAHTGATKMQWQCGEMHASTTKVWQHVHVCWQHRVAAGDTKDKGMSEATGMHGGNKGTHWIQWVQQRQLASTKVHCQGQEMLGWQQG